MPTTNAITNLATVSPFAIGLALDFWKKKIGPKAKRKLNGLNDAGDEPIAEEGDDALDSEDNPIPPEWEDVMDEDEFKGLQSVPVGQWDELGLDDFDLSDPHVREVVMGVIKEDLPETALDELKQENKSWLAGTIGIGSWLATSAALLAIGGILGGILGSGGLKKFGDGAKKAVEDGITDQLDFLTGFAQELEDGEVSPEQMDARTAMYAGAAGNILANLASREAALAAGMLWERRVLSEDTDSHCECCVDNAAEGWQPIGTLDDVGSCSCVSNCKCHFEHSDSEEPPADDDGAVDFARDLHAAVASAAADTNTSPTPAQAEAGNYKKGKLTWNGLTITLENPKGSTRTKVGGDGKPWSRVLAHHYGYLNRTTASDGDAVDVFMGPNPHSEMVFVVDQEDKDGAFDEVKVMLGFDNEADAKAGYLANYPSGWKVGAITPMTLPDFKAWLESGDTGKPVSMQVSA